MNEADWRHLLGRIRAGNVVPILGPQLLADANGQSSLQARTAEKLLARYGNSVKPGSLPPFRELNESVARLQPSLGQKIYTEVDDLLHEAVNEADAAPPAIQQLSEIEDFRLFVTLTPDDCLARSLTKRCTVNEVFNSPYLGTEEKSRDLPADWHQRLGEVQLLYLFGKASPAPTFAVHDEDVLEYAHHLMSPGKSTTKEISWRATRAQSVADRMQFSGLAEPILS